MGPFFQTPMGHVQNDTEPVVQSCPSESMETWNLLGKKHMFDKNGGPRIEHETARKV